MKLQNRSHAIVIGGSIAGLCAASALSRHFERVTLIERDPLPSCAEHRVGVPQSHHLHALLLRGLLELERLFPGIERELIAAGAERMDLGNDVAYCTAWGWAPRARIDVAPLTMSRLLVEGVIRARVRSQIANLTVCDGRRVVGLKTEREEERVRVSGVLLAGGEPASLSADLVVDASGRGSRCLDWLERAGVERPNEELVDAFAGYASRFYELAPDPARWWRGMVVEAKAPVLTRWGLLMPVEGGRAILTLAGVNGDYPPSDEASFRHYMSSLLSPRLARETAHAKPVSDIHTHRGLSNRARHFERWKRDIGGFVALGDSAIAFNAQYGQGMSMAALSANTLSDVLEDASSVDAYWATRRFHTLQWKQLRRPWLFATGADLEWPGTLGKRGWDYRLKVALSVSVVRAAHEDSQVKRMIGPIFQLVAEPSSVLLRPDFLARVLFAELRRRLGGPLTLPVQDFEKLASGGASS